MNIPCLGQPPEGLHILPVNLEEVRAVALAEQFSWHDIDLNSITTVPEALDALATSLQFPDWFGRNLDALLDCLVDLSWHTSRGHVLVLTGTATLAAADAEGLESLLEVLGEAARTWAMDKYPFWVFADVPGLPYPHP